MEEAARLLAELGEGAKVIAAGRAWCRLRTSASPGPTTWSTSTGCGLEHVRVGDDAVEVGATVRTADLLRDPAVAVAHPLLAAATGWIAHPVIRNRGTVCGSLAHADPAAELPAVLALLDGGRGGGLARGALACRWLAAELFPGPFETSLAPDELVVAARFRLAPGTGWAMDERARRHGDYAVAGVVLTVTADGRGTPTGGRAAYLSCAPTGRVDLGPALAEADGGRRRCAGESGAGPCRLRPGGGGVEPDRRHPRHGRLPPPPGDAHGSEPRPALSRAQRRPTPEERPGGHR